MTSADPFGAGSLSVSTMCPGAYASTWVVITSGAGSELTCAPWTLDDVSKMATLRTGKLVALYASLTAESGYLIMSGATHANGCSPGRRKSDTAVPAASRTGPTIRRAPGIGIESVLIRKNSAFSSAHTVGFAY